jgi:hypothetical protein
MTMRLLNCELALNLRNWNDFAHFPDDGQRHERATGSASRTS